MGTVLGWPDKASPLHKKERVVNTSRLRLVTAGILLLTLVSTWAADSKSAGQGDFDRQTACELNRANVTMKYLLYLPKQYQQKPSWPLLLFLHGSGGQGDDLALVRRDRCCKR